MSQIKTNEETLLETKKVELEILKLQTKNEKLKLDNNAKLTKKLNTIATGVIGLKKDAGKTNGNAGISYDYVTGDKIYKNIKPLMKEQGVDIDPSFVPGTFKVELMEYTLNKWDKYQKKNVDKHYREYMVTGTLEYTISDTETGFSFKSHWPYVGTQYDDPAKAYGTALTYADKYYFLKRFHIATDKDDADAKIVKQIREEKKNEGNTNDEDDPAPFKLESKDVLPLMKAFATKNGLEPGPKSKEPFYAFVYKETNTSPASGKKPTEVITSQEQYDSIKAKLGM